MRLTNWRRRFWKPALEAAGIDPPITPHELRHSAITMWMREGVDIRTIAARAGHTSVKTVADVYAKAAAGVVPADDRVSERASAVVLAATRAH